MPKKPLKILAINPGSRYLGIAVFNGSELKDWRIKVIDGRNSREKIEKVKTIFSGFIEQYEPNILSIKRLHPSRSSRNLNLLVVKIMELSKRKGLKIYEYSIKNVENFLSFDERIKNKRQLADAVASQYPFLFHELNKEKNHKNPYFIRMFEAIGLGIICFNRLDHK